MTRRPTNAPTPEQALARQKSNFTAEGAPAPPAAPPSAPQAAPPAAARAPAPAIAPPTAHGPASRRRWPR